MGKIILGRGRDGTRSLSFIIKEIIKDKKLDFKPFHEYLLKENYNFLNRNYKNKTKLNKKFSKYFTENIKEKIIPIGAGNIFFIPFISEEILKKLDVIWLNRDFKSWVYSQILICITWQQNWGNYFPKTKNSKTNIYQPAPWMFGKYDKYIFNEKLLEQKLFWYYKFSEKIINKYKHKFNSFEKIDTSNINQVKNIEKISKFLGTKISNKKKYFTTAHQSNFTNLNTKRFYKDLDFNKSANDPKILTIYAHNKIIKSYYKENFYPKINKRYLKEYCLLLDKLKKNIK